VILGRQINRLAGAYDFDTLLAVTTQAAKYDTFQTTIQPNCNGGW
jgi:hypothetical protein